jgi:hypothetical protein
VKETTGRSSSRSASSETAKQRLSRLVRQRPLLCGFAVAMLLVAIDAGPRLYSHFDDRGYFTFGLPGSLPQAVEQRVPTEVFGKSTAFAIDSPAGKLVDDPRPLDRGEVFREDAKQPSDGEVELVLQGIRTDTRCTDTVWGPELRTLLLNGGCLQVVRGLYTDRDARWIGQVTIFNMQDAGASRSLITRLESHHDAGFVLALTGSDPLDRLGRGYSQGSASAYGHYVLLTWEQRTDGTEPSEQDTDLRSVDNALNRVRDALIRRNNEAT